MQSLLRVLLLEDQPDEAERTLLELKRAGFETIVRSAITREEYLEALAAPLDLILSDLTLPGFDGLEALKLMQQRGLDIPFVFVSSTPGEDLAVAAMKQAAADYLVQERLARLGPSIQEALQRRKLQQEKRQAEQAASRLAAIVESTSDAIFSATLDGVVLSWNPAAERLYGLRAGEILGQPATRLVPATRRPSDVLEDPDEIRRKLSRGDAIPVFESLRVRKDGRRIEVSLCMSPIPDAAGTIVAFSTTARDITDRKRAERCLAAEHVITRMMSQSSTLEEVAPRLLQTLGENLRWKVALLWRVDRQAEVLRCVQGWHSPGAELAGFKSECCDTVLEPGAGIPGKAWLSGEPVWTPEACRDMDSPRSMSATRAGLHAGFGLPLRLDDRVEGVIEFYNPMMQRPDGPLLEMLLSVAHQVSQFIGRQQSEVALRESEQRFRQVTENIREVFWLFDVRDQTMLYVSPAYETIWGRSLQSLRDRPRSFLEAVHAEDRERVESALAGGWTEGLELEYRILKPDGAVRWIRDRGYSIRGEDGEVERLVGVADDITARKLAEGERDLLLVRLRMQIDRMPLGYILLDAELRVADWNSAAERIFGYTREEVLGMGPPYEKLIPRADWTIAQTILSRLRKGDMEAGVINRTLTRDGRTITCEWFNTPLFEADGTFVGVISLADDITARQAGEELLRLRDRAIQAVSQGILITDANLPDHPIIYASPSFERMTGYPIGEVVGRNCRFLQGKETDPEAVARLRERIALGEACREELVNYKKDGSRFWNELSISPVRDPDGTLTHFVGVQTDVTERRLLEEQYRHSQKMESIGQLAGGVAHDFNNLLTIISGYSELLLQRLKPGDPSLALVREIHQAGERSAALTRQLLVFSRKQIVAPRVLDLNALVADAERMLRRLIGEDVKLSTALRPGPAFVKADHGQLEQVLMNLTVNARDAMPQGGQLTLETAAVEIGEDYCRGHAGVRPGSYVMLAVSDTGCGIPPAIRARIFEPFFTTKSAGSGTGLGLAVVHGIVKEAAGHVEVYSEPAVGTTFKVYLPSAEPRPGSARPAASALTAPPGSETILLVEDEDSLRAFARHVLADCGYVILEAADGNEALLIAERHPESIHLLLTDVVMPGMGGRQLADRILAIHAGARVLYLSGYTDDAVFRHGVLRDEVQFLQKPFSPLALALKVRAVLDA